MRRIFCAQLTGLIIALMLIPGCQTLQVPKERHANAPFLDKETKQQLEALQNFAMKKIELSPGKVRLLEFPYFGPFQTESLRCDGAEVSFWHPDNQRRAFAYIALPYDQKATEFSCIFSFGNESLIHHELGSFQAVTIEYPKELLNVNNNIVNLSKANKKRVAREKEQLDNIFKNSSSKLLFSVAFSAPLSSKITSVYGMQRIFNGVQKSVHFGTDYRAPLGTPIKAANNGRVAFVGELFYAGNIVIIDHGLGIFTCYMHLSKILVKVNEKVRKESIVGLSGQSGRANGPHLHWGAKINGQWVDALSLIEASEHNFTSLAQAKN